MAPRLPLRRFLLLSVLHILLVQVDLLVYRHGLTPYSQRYLSVADEFASLDIASADPAKNCVTAPGYPLFLA